MISINTASLIKYVDTQGEFLSGAIAVDGANVYEGLDSASVFIGIKLLINHMQLLVVADERTMVLTPKIEPTLAPEAVSMLLVSIYDNKDLTHSKSPLEQLFYVDGDILFTGVAETEKFISEYRLKLSTAGIAQTFKVFDFIKDNVPKKYRLDSELYV